MSLAQASSLQTALMPNLRLHKSVLVQPAVGGKLVNGRAALQHVEPEGRLAAYLAKVIALVRVHPTFRSATAQRLASGGAQNGAIAAQCVVTVFRRVMSLARAL